MKIYSCKGCNLLFNQTVRKPMNLSCGDVICQACLAFQFNEASKKQGFFNCPFNDAHTIDYNFEPFENLHILQNLSSQEFLNIQCDKHSDEMVKIYCQKTEELICGECVIIREAFNNSKSENDFFKVSRKGFEGYAQNIILALVNLQERIKNLLNDLLSFKNKDKIFMGSEFMKLVKNVKQVFQDKACREEFSKSCEDILDDTAQNSNHEESESEYQILKQSQSLSDLFEQSSLSQKGSRQEQATQMNPQQKEEEKKQENNIITQEIKSVASVQLQTIPEQLSALKLLETNPQYMNYRKLVDFQITTNQEFLIRDNILNQQFLKFQLIYKGSRDGFASQDFHQYCNNLGPTILFALTEHGKVFGGYVSVPWNSNNLYTVDQKAFVFSLTNKTKHLQFQNLQQAALHSSSHSWIQGGGHDILISHDCDKNHNSLCNLGHTYQTPTGLSHGQDNTKSYLGGAKNFKILEIEVYRVVFV
ncbi:tldc domain-containing protein [Stylonychia lemnae]|uniref:Tldc domain-containing protein n=1 Tax=Stylonychia lemnae TaxID=5949 RepID=A0A078ARK2_STYLE|nr:tldc domain-containing protein [Stylonychia lemnae]|eukprot:CDW85095.1 tldc domain-containing protein [Stylonychia lemnae]